MSAHSKIPSGLGTRRDQTYQEYEHDTYPQGAVVEMHQTTVNQIMDAFHKADAAITAGNLDGVWRIRGNIGETPCVLPVGMAPHLLF